MVDTRYPVVTLRNHLNDFVSHTTRKGESIALIVAEWESFGYRVVKTADSEITRMVCNENPGYSITISFAESALCDPDYCSPHCNCNCRNCNKYRGGDWHN